MQRSKQAQAVLITDEGGNHRSYLTVPLTKGAAVVLMENSKGSHSCSEHDD